MLAFHSFFCALALLQAPHHVAPRHIAVALEELELAPGNVLPHYAGDPPWRYAYGPGDARPWAVIEGAQVFFGDGDELPFLTEDSLGVLAIRVEESRELRGHLYLPKASGDGFLRREFTVPASARGASEREFQLVEREHYRALLPRRLPGAAWFRHRVHALDVALEPALGASAANETDAPWQPWAEHRDPDDALALFSGGRALYENLQLERGLPALESGAASVALDSLPGIEVRAFDWQTRLTQAETRLDRLAALVPADQHALFFPRFAGLVDVLDEAQRLGAFGLATVEGRSADAHTRERYERQLCLALDEVARALGPLAIRSAALTGSDPYLRAGSDVAVLLEVEPAFRERVLELLRARQLAAGHGQEPVGAGRGWRACSPARGVCAHLFTLAAGDDAGAGVIAISNSSHQSERLLAVADGAPALAASDEYRFFRQRYVLGAEDESALLVLPDEAIRRWCSPRWRIAAARRVRAAAELAEQHALHLAKLVAGVASERELGTAADFPELGALHLGPDGVRSARYGTLAFQTPIAELSLTHVTQREAELYRAWREGYERAWSNYFDPIGARLGVSADGVALDLTVMPLILGTAYDDLREATRGPGLVAGSGDEHPEALIRFAMGIDREWELLRGIGSTLGAAGEKLGADPLSWLGSWLAVYVDDGPIWDEYLDGDEHDPGELFDDGNLNHVPLAVTVAVANPLKLALFLTSLRAFVDGTAPGLTVWKDRTVGERRFVQISSAGLGESVAIFYATTPTALILSLHEETLLAAVQRAEARQAQPVASGSAAGAHAALELRGRGLGLLRSFVGLQDELRAASFANLPILAEWKRLFPGEDPLAVHERAFGETLVCPGGGTYAWNAEWNAMESSVFGHPGNPRPGVRYPPAWEAFSAFHSRLTFEDDGLRVELELERE